MGTVCFVALLSDTDRHYGLHNIEWVPFGEDQTEAREFAKGKGLNGKDAKVALKLDSDPLPSQKTVCIHEARNWGNADRIFQDQGEYWSEFTCIHCKSKFVQHAGPLVGR